MSRKLITILTPCYNEELNVREVHRRLMAVADGLPEYRFEHLFIDNASTDGTVSVLRAIAAKDSSVKVMAQSTAHHNSYVGCHSRTIFTPAIQTSSGDPVDRSIDNLRALENVQYPIPTGAL